MTCSYEFEYGRNSNDKKILVSLLLTMAICVSSTVAYANEPIETSTLKLSEQKMISLNKAIEDLNDQAVGLNTRSGYNFNYETLYGDFIHGMSPGFNGMQIWPALMLENGNIGYYPDMYDYYNGSDGKLDKQSCISGKLNALANLPQPSIESGWLGFYVEIYYGGSGRLSFDDTFGAVSIEDGSGILEMFIPYTKNYQAELLSTHDVPVGLQSVYGNYIDLDLTVNG